MPLFRKAVRAGVLGVLLVAGARGLGAQSIPVIVDNDHQSAAEKVPSFDVASVKENKSGSRMMRWQVKEDGVAVTNLSLKNLIALTYGIKQDMIFGLPSWAEATGFDLDAKVAGEDVPTLKKLSGEQRRAMLKPVLAERFGLKLHEESKVLPIYELVVAKGGPKIKADVPEKPAADGKPDEKKGGYINTSDGRIEARAFSIDAFASNLSYAVGREVANKTGLNGNYDFDLKWTPEERGATAGDNGTAESGPSIFTAVQEQLGLRLQSGKGPVKTLVVDQVEKPVEN